MNALLFALSLLLTVVGVSVTTAQSNATGVLQIHASGDGVAAYEINKVMDLLESRTKPLVYLSFRACGTTAAQTEFMGPAGTPSPPPYNNFGMGDIPLSSAQYAGLSSAGAKPLHLPFLLAKISFFSSVPSSATGTAGLYLSACTLAKIYSGQITTWNDDAISADNPGIVVPPSTPLRVYKIAGEDAATRGITKYLNYSCPGSWAFGVSASLDAVAPASVLTVADTAGMHAALDPGSAVAVWSLGYIDSHEGLKAGLSEVRLSNQASVKLTSSMADDSQVATALSTYPGIDADWSGVAFLNNPAASSWPIVVVSYFYVRVDSSFLGQAGGLLKVFLTLALSDEVQGIMTENGLVSLLGSTRADLLAQLNSKLVLAPGPTFSFENSSAVQPILGQADYVVSSLRTTFTSSELWDHEAEVASQLAALAALRAQLVGISLNLSVAQQVRDQLYQATQTNAQNAANILKVQSIAVAGVVLAVVIALVALIVGAVWIAKTRAIATKYQRIMSDWMPGGGGGGGGAGRHDPGGKMAAMELASSDVRF